MQTNNRTAKPNTYVDPLRQKSYDDPLTKPYEDPLRVPPTSYKFEPKKIEYTPYTSIHVFEPSNIDPLTGRPYRTKQKNTEDTSEKSQEKQVRASVCTCGPAAEKRDIEIYASSEDPDQHAHPRSLVRILAVHCSPTHWDLVED